MFVSSFTIIYLISKSEWNKLVSTSLHTLTNMLLLSFIFASIIYIGFDILDLKMSFIDSWRISRNILGFCLLFSILIKTINMIYINRKEPLKIVISLINIALSLLVLSFFSQIFFIVFCAFDLILADFFDEYKKDLNVESEPKTQNLNPSFNYHFTKYYPIISYAKGNYLYTEDGNKIFDAATGAGVTSIGYGNSEVIKAMTDKLNNGTHYLASSYWKDSDVLKLCKKLVDSTDGKLVKVYLTGSGSDATEATIKLVRQFYYDQDNNTGREYFISRERSYHGNTTGALGLSEFTARQMPFKPILLSKVEHVSSCYAYRQLTEGESIEDFVSKKANELENKILEIGPEKVAAVILEPVVGAALGCVPAVTGYLKAMQDVCHKYQIIFVLDEIMCGMGRTGTLHAWQAEGVVPDVLLLGKGLAAGYHPLAAVMISPMICEGLKSEQFIHGLTYDAMPVGAVAALKVLDIIERDSLVKNVLKQGNYLEKQLKDSLYNHPNVGDIRGSGLFWGIELVKDKATKEPFDPKLGVAQKIVELGKSSPFNMTIYMGTGTVDGVHGDHIMIVPPFTITEEDVDYIVETISTVINLVFQEMQN